MSHSLNQAQAPSASPRLRNTSTRPAGSSHTRARTEDQNTSGQPRLHSNLTSGNATNSGVVNPRHRLHEFHSLLEAAQRIANSAPFDTEGHRWREDDQPEPIIHLNRPRLGESSQRLTSLGRYRGRPHVPGEDSGSEEEDRDNIMDTDDRSQHEHRVEEGSRHSSHHSTGAEIENHMPIAPQYPSVPNDNVNFQPRSDQSRTRDRQPEEDEEQDLLEQLAARTRAARSRFEADNQLSRYSTTGATPTSQSFYDWAPEPSNTSDPAPSIFRSRPRALSGASAVARRWRPAERLQDYASNHARRDAGSNPSGQGPATELSSTGADDGSDVMPSGVADSNLGSHEDVVDRVERALQQYRIARRALRPLNVDVAFEAIRQSEDVQFTNQPETRPVPDAMLSDRSNATREAPNIRMTSMSSRERTELSGVGSRDYTSPTTVSRTTSTGLQRREDPLRQRIRDQIRERRRRGVQQALELSAAGQEPPLARGPLFENNPTPQFSVPSDARRMIEQVRQTHIRESSAEFKRAKGALQYLARLRDPELTEVMAWKIAHELGLHNKSLEEEADNNLPWSLESLPKPTHSSWLEPGMTWTGIQDANDSTERTMRLSETTIDSIAARNHRERLELASRQHESFRSRIGLARDPLERAIYGGSTNDPIGSARNSVQLLEDAERSLTSMLERSQELLRENDRQLRENDERITLLNEAVRRRAEGRQRQPSMLNASSTQPNSSPDSDWWNVKVTLHSVDEKRMTISGTMTASHKLNRPSYSVASGTDEEANSDSSENSMDSFFTGEIIDFANHGLDTLPSSNRAESSSASTSSRNRRQQDEWKVGGPETDLTYWAGIGPFKQEIDRAIKAKERQNDLDRAMHLDAAEHSDKHNGMTDISADKHRLSSSSSSPTPEDPLTTPLTEEEEYATKMDTMASLLSNTTWLNENIGTQGWILMRWKERCFVAPGTQPNPDVRRPWISGNSPRSPTTNNTTAEDPTASSSWNVNDLIAHHRLRRRRERDSRVWSTNAAERDEIATSTTATATGTSGERGPAWGLTISGFYYVALERKTGRIEALYFDCGSTPFQRLKMGPERVRRVPGYSKGEEMDVDVDVEGGEERKVDLSGIVGVKSSFGVVEFR